MVTFSEANQEDKELKEVMVLLPMNVCPPLPRLQHSQLAFPAFHTLWLYKCIESC